MKTKLIAVQSVLLFFLFIYFCCTWLFCPSKYNEGNAVMAKDIVEWQYGVVQADESVKLIGDTFNSNAVRVGIRLQGEQRVIVQEVRQIGRCWLKPVYRYTVKSEYWTPDNKKHFSYDYDVAENQLSRY